MASQDTGGQKRASKTSEEVDEVAHALLDDRAQAAHEIGDLLAAVITLARHCGVDPELALRSSVGRFRARFEHMVATAQRPLDDLSLDEWLALWADATSAT